MTPHNQTLSMMRSAPIAPPNAEHILIARFTRIFQRYMSCSSHTCEIPHARRNEFIEALAREATRPARYY